MHRKLATLPSSLAEMTNKKSKRKKPRAATELDLTAQLQSLFLSPTGSGMQEALARAGASGDLDAPDPESGWTPLLEALAILDWPVATKLLELGASTSKVAPDGEWPGTALNYVLTDEACFPDAPQMHGMLVPAEHRAGFAQLLLAHKADPNQEHAQNLATIRAAAAGEADLLRMLLDANADANAARSLDQTRPLCWAGQSGHLTCVRMLLDANAEIDAHPAAQEVPFRDDKSSTALQTATALFAACHAGHIAVAHELLERGASPEIPISDGFTPLMLAAEKSTVELAKVLIEGRACVDAVGRLGTPLVVACRQGDIMFVRLVLEAGAR